MNRLEGLVPRDHVLILTNQDQEAAVRALAPHPAPGEYRGRTGQAGHGGGHRAGRGLGLAAGRGGHHDRAAGGPSHPGSGGFPGHAPHGGGGRAGNGEPGHHRHQAHLGLPGVRLHRGRGGGARSRALPGRCARWRASAKSRIRNWPSNFSSREISAGTRACSSGRSPPSWRSSCRHAAPLAEFVEQLHASGDFAGTLAAVSRICRRFRSTTPSWKRRSGCWWWRPGSTGMTSGAGRPSPNT